MPYAVPNRTRTLPRPPAPRQGRAVRASGGAGATLAQLLGGWSFVARIWVAFEPPTSAAPTWIEVTQFVDMEQPISIVHGRTDGVSDVNAATCSLTVDNSDGRWCAGNPSGAWYGLIRKGAWLKVDVIPLSGVVSTRYVGFINNLPTTWNGQYASSQITAADRFERIGQNPAITSAVQSEVLTDPNLAGAVKGYWNLHEASVAQGGVTSFGDTSGAGAAPMTLATSGAVPAGTGFAAAAVDGPGFDGTKAVAFTPPGGAFSATGSYLTTSITAPTGGTFNLATGAYTGLYATVEFWFKATNSIQGMLACLIDYSSQFTVLCYYDQGYVFVDTGVTTQANTALMASTLTVAAPRGRVDDGNWHHLIIGVAATNSGGGWLNRVVVQDGWLVASGATNNVGGGTVGMAFTQLTIGAALTVGALAGTNYMFGAADVSDVAYYYGDLAGYTNTPPDAASHYAAGATGFYGESTDSRIARVARYTGIPTPVTSTASGLLPGSVKRYAPGIAGPWTNLGAGAHACGTQAMGGRAGLDVMREAARTENQPLFGDRSGFLAIQPSTIRQNTSAAWTVDSRDLDESTGLPDDFSYTTNVATITPNGQAAQTVVGTAGAASQAKYGIYSNGGQLATASITPLEAQNLGLAVIAPRADPPPRWSPVTLEAATLAQQAGYGAAWYDAVLATEISTPFRITNLPAQAGGGLTDNLVEGWNETLTGGQHVFAFAVSPVQGATYQLDSATLGLIDTAGVSLAY